MDSFTLILSVVALLYIGGTIYLANVQEREKSQSGTARSGRLLNWLLYGIAAVILYLGLNVVAVATLAPGSVAAPEPESPPVSVTAALVALVVSALASAVSILVVASPATRLAIRRALGSSVRYDPDSGVHTTGIVMALALLAVVAAQFVLGGGIVGLAEMIETSGISLGEVTFTGLLWVVVALLGVGLAVRRTLPAVLERLGLRAPTRQDITAGIGVGLLLYLLSIAVLAVWSAVVPPEQLLEQTAAAEQLGQAINSLPLVLAVSLTAAVGEEIFFRGAMQPVFGMVPVSIFFALLHTQYVLPLRLPCPAVVTVLAVRGAVAVERVAAPVVEVLAALDARRQSGARVLVADARAAVAAVVGAVVGVRRAVRDARAVDRLAAAVANGAVRAADGGAG